MQLLILNLSSVAFASTNPIPSSSIFSLSVTLCVWVFIGLKVLKEINAEVCLCLSVFRAVSRGKSTAEAPKEKEQSRESVSVPWDFLYIWLSDCGALSLDMDYHSLSLVFIVKSVQLPLDFPNQIKMLLFFFFFFFLIVKILSTYHFSKN